MNGRASTSTPRSRTGTPIKAITSTLAARAAPAVPLAAQLHEPRVRGALRRRLTRAVFPGAAAAAWALAGWWTAWLRGGADALGVLRWLASWASPAALAAAAAWWALGALPVVVLRKAHVTATSTTSVSPQQTLRLQVAQPRSRRALLVLATSSVALTLSHSLMSYFVELDGRGDPRLGVWGRSKKHPYHVNGRLVYLLLTQLVIAVAFWLRDTLKDRFAVRLTRHSDTSQSSSTALYYLVPSVISTILLAAFSTAFATALFAISRMFLFPMVYRIPILHGLLRPFTAHFLRPKYTLTFLWTHFDLIVRAFFVNVTTALIWDISSSLFDLSSSLPVRAADGTKTPALVLVSGVDSNDPYFQHHAFHELASLASDPSANAQAKRAAIYSDTKYSPTMWASLVRQSLLLLGRDYQLLLRRGAPPPPAPAPAPAPAAPKEPEKPATPLIRKPIFKAARASPLATLADALASDGALTQAFEETADDTIGLPELFKAASAVLPSPKRIFSAVAGAGTTPVQQNGGQGAAAPAVRGEPVHWKAQLDDAVVTVKYVWKGAWWKESGLAAWWTRERKNKAAEKSLPNKDLDAMIVEVVSNLIAHSLLEDTLGNVQRDIPRVLEAFLSYLSALEEYQAELNGLYPSMTPEQQARLNSEDLMSRERLRVEVLLASEWIGELANSLRTAVGLVVRTFGDRLLAFRFPPRTASKLQGFVDYST